MTVVAKSTHTPGPWQLRSTESNEKCNFRNNVTTVVETVDEEGDEICWLRCESVNEAANARLIAAAPELLTELKKLWLNSQEVCDWSNEYQDRIDRLIAKAEGT